MLTDTELSAIRARAEAATPGPWQFVTDKHRQDSIYTVCAVKSMFIPFNGTNRKHDSSFCAHARTDIPALLAHIDEQRAEIEHLKRALEWIAQSDCRGEGNSTFLLALVPVLVKQGQVRALHRNNHRSLHEGNKGCKK